LKRGTKAIAVRSADVPPGDSGRIFGYSEVGPRHRLLPLPFYLVFMNAQVAIQFTLTKICRV